MLGWLKQRITGTQQTWFRVQQSPGVIFPFPKSAKLRPEEEVVLAFPAALITGDEEIGSVLLCDENAELTLNDEVGAWYVRLKPGMTFCLSKSCDVMLIAGDNRPRAFQFMKPDNKPVAGTSPE